MLPSNTIIQTQMERAGVGHPGPTVHPRQEGPFCVAVWQVLSWSLWPGPSGLLISWIPAF